MKFQWLTAFLLSWQVAYGQNNLETIVPHWTATPRLNYFMHVPDSIEKGDSVTLIVVLHGCYQSAAEINRVAGWSSLSDAHRFILLFPEERKVNNVASCFNWFVEDELFEPDGELHEIITMVDQIRQDYTISRENSFVYGVSAGGMMSVSLLAQYPGYFSAGAVLAAGPYGVTGAPMEIMRIMASPIDRTPTEWASFVNIPDSVAIPKVIIGHGTADRVVNYKNATELIEQWTAVHGIDLGEDSTYAFPQNQFISRDAYNDSNGAEKVVAYTFEGLGHTIPIDPGNGPEQGGETGRFAEDLNFFSTYHILKEFGIIDEQ